MVSGEQPDHDQIPIRRRGSALRPAPFRRDEGHSRPTCSRGSCEASNSTPSPRRMPRIHSPHQGQPPRESNRTRAAPWLSAARRDDAAAVGDRAARLGSASDYGCLTSPGAWHCSQRCAPPDRIAGTTCLRARQCDPRVSSEPPGRGHPRAELCGLPKAAPAVSFAARGPWSARRFAPSRPGRHKAAASGIRIPAQLGDHERHPLGNLAGLRRRRRATGGRAWQQLRCTSQSWPQLKTGVLARRLDVRPTAKPAMLWADHLDADAIFA
jgi:hypothetical protein